MPAILALAFTLRLAAVFLLPDQHFPDTDNYRHLIPLADNIMPLYPILVWIAGPLQGVMDTTFSTVTVWLIYRLTLEISGDRRAALISSSFAAVYPFFIFYSAVGLTESLYCMLVCAAFLCWYRGRFAWGSVWMVLGILTRPTLDLLAPGIIIWFSILSNSRAPSWRSHARNVPNAAKHFLSFLLSRRAKKNHFAGATATNATGTSARLKEPKICNF